MSVQQLQCQTCGGIYAPVQADGLAYFHACSPIGLDALRNPIERPNKRDENLTVDRSGKLSGIRNDGQGVKPATGSTLQDHPVLAKLLHVDDDEEG